MAFSGSSQVLLINSAFIFFSLIMMITLLPASHASLNVTEFISQILDGHNAARQEVGVPPLTYEPMLARVARVFANERRHDCKNIYSPGQKFGEVIFTREGNSWTAEDAIASWVSQKEFYDHESNTCAIGETCSDYTQMVWRTTIRVGCAQIMCDSRDTFIVCEYYPPGNYIGNKPY